MFVSIAGHASFHTAGSSGPSMIDLSYRDDFVAAAVAAVSLARLAVRTSAQFAQIVLLISPFLSTALSRDRGAEQS
jgi:hypothetical protein